MATTPSKHFKARQVTRPRDQVEQQLREAILDGHFTQGEKLPAETELAQQFGVSRPTIREALGALVSSSLIRKVPGVAGGSFVNTVTPDSLGEMLSDSMGTILRIGALEIDEITEMRRVLEIPAARRAARDRSEEDVAAMYAVIEQQKATTLDDPNIPDYDCRFHTAIGDAAGNRLLSAFVGAVHRTTRPARFLEVTKEVAQKTIKQHIAIAAAIESQDPDSAADAMRDHLDYVQKFSIPS